MLHLARQFQRRLFRYRPIRNKNCLWWPCLLTDRDEMSNRHRGHSIDTSYQVSVNLAKLFQRRRFLKILLWNCLAKWSIYMYVEGSVLSFLKAEWKVSDTGSAHWASSLLLSYILVFIEKMNPIFILILSFVLIFFTLLFCGLNYMIYTTNGELNLQVRERWSLRWKI